MTLFRAAQAAAAVVIGQIFGESFEVRPMKMLSGRIVPDPERSPIALSAIYTEHSAFSDPIGERNASGMSKGVASSIGAGFATIEFKTTSVPYAVVAKDRFVRTETSEFFEVSGVQTTDLDHLVARVVRLGVAP